MGHGMSFLRLVLGFSVCEGVGLGGWPLLPLARAFLMDRFPALPASSWCAKGLGTVRKLLCCLAWHLSAQVFLVPTSPSSFCLNSMRNRTNLEISTHTEYASSCNT